MSFSDIPIRKNGQKVDASWWNTIRSKLIAAFGGGVVGSTPVTINDNQSSYLAITDLVVDGAFFSYALVRYSIYRTDGTIERRESGFLHLTYKQIADVWSLERESRFDDALNIADSLIVTTASSVAAVEYKSDAMGGTYSGKITFAIVQTFDLEV